ncbi:TetR/AcrR family transcriptional regulator [Streptomyces sp. NBC_00103]|uniref:TetR/AcrR family transcriptional regulator n=1 Tax=unclassified Streptomyces TaxID=2593676 RepID=UPI002B1E2C57|nr:TetR/AcrR family transcriptional regulator [Streptomyces sp. NBC_00103]
MLFFSAAARETGVGIATVCRHFPTKEELVAAVFSDRMDAYADAVATALVDPDPWHGCVAERGKQPFTLHFGDSRTSRYPAGSACSPGA